MKRALIVHDDRALDIKKYLTDAGFVSDIAENGPEAYDAIKQKKYDVLLLDSEIPADRDRMIKLGVDTSVDVAKAFKAANPDSPMHLTSIAYIEEKEYFDEVGVDTSAIGSTSTLTQSMEHIGKKIGTMTNFESKSLGRLTVAEIRKDPDFKYPKDQLVTWANELNAARQSSPEDVKSKGPQKG